MGKSVARGVYASDGTYYAPGDTPTKEHAEEFTNPKVWTAPDEEVVAEESDMLDPAPPPEVPAPEEEDAPAPSGAAKKAPAKKASAAS